MTGRTPRGLLRVVAATSQRPDGLGALARAAAAGEEAAVHTFLVSVGPHLLRMVRKILGSTHPEVEDVVQECALAVIDALPAHRGECSVLHFVCRIAILVAMKVRRRERAHKRLSVREDDLGVEQFPSTWPAPDAVLSARVTADLVRDLIDTLPLEQAEVFALHCMAGYTVPEIAESSRASIETVRSRLRLAKGALRKRVQANGVLEDLAKESS